MANKKKWLGLLLAGFMIFGMTGVAYAQSAGGTLTLTDIPARFNGKYVLLFAENYNVELLGVQNYNLTTDTATLPQIVNGRVSIPMWIIIDDGQTEELVRYNGNHTVEVDIEIFDTAILDENSNDIAYIYFERITFSNGSATVTFQDNDEFEAY